MADQLTNMAIQAVPQILEGIGHVCGQFAVPLCDAIKTYGCRNQTAIVKMVEASVPSFAQYSVAVMQRLGDFVEVAEKSSSKNYELIVEVITKASDLSTEAKVNQVLRLERQRYEHRFSLISLIGKFFTIIAGIFALIFGVNNYTKIKSQQVEEQGKNDRSLTYNLFHKGR